MKTEEKSMKKVDKTSDEYGDHMYQQQKDARIDESLEKVKQCKHCDGWLTTRRDHYPTREKAASQQYDILRGSDRIVEGRNTCVGNDFEIWWWCEGSAPPKQKERNSNGFHPPLSHDDWETHCKKMCEIAWKNGFYFKQR